MEFTHGKFASVNDSPFLLTDPFATITSKRDPAVLMSRITGMEREFETFFQDDDSPQPSRKVKAEVERPVIGDFFFNLAMLEWHKAEQDPEPATKKKGYLLA